VTDARPVDVARAVPAVLRSHPSVHRVELVGSRADGRAHDLSDWDFAVETSDFAAVEHALPELVHPLRPVAEQWDPYSSYACYMLMLAGPTKVDLLFPGERREWSPPWDASPQTLEAIDRHFWDWILWLEQKRRGGNMEALANGLHDLHRLLLRPMGVARKPATVAAATGAYVTAREGLERRFDVIVSRALEREVRPLVQ
jgi:hypothetical protein